MEAEFSSASAKTSLMNYSNVIRGSESLWRFNLLEITVHKPHIGKPFDFKFDLYLICFNFAEEFQNLSPRIKHSSGCSISTKKIDNKLTVSYARA